VFGGELSMNDVIALLARYMNASFIMFLIKKHEKN